MVEKKVNKNEIIFNEGSEANAAYIVQSGEFQISKKMDIKGIYDNNDTKIEKNSRNYNDQNCLYQENQNKNVSQQNFQSQETEKKMVKLGKISSHRFFGEEDIIKFRKRLTSVKCIKTGIIYIIPKEIFQEYFLGVREIQQFFEQKYRQLDKIQNKAQNFTDKKNVNDFNQQRQNKSEQKKPYNINQYSGSNLNQITFSQNNSQKFGQSQQQAQQQNQGSCNIINKYNNNSINSAIDNRKNFLRNFFSQQGQRSQSCEESNVGQRSKSKLINNQSQIKIKIPKKYFNESNQQLNTSNTSSQRMPKKERKLSNGGSPKVDFKLLFQKAKLTENQKSEFIKCYSQSQSQQLSPKSQKITQSAQNRHDPETKYNCVTEPDIQESQENLNSVKGIRKSGGKLLMRPKFNIQNNFKKSKDWNSIKNGNNQNDFLNFRKNQNLEQFEFQDKKQYTEQGKKSQNSGSLDFSNQSSPLINNSTKQQFYDKDSDINSIGSNRNLELQSANSKDSQSRRDILKAFQEQNRLLLKNKSPSQQVQNQLQQHFNGDKKITLQQLENQNNSQIQNIQQ
ncbi:Cyclic nucleotide-binding protein [Pseudocohnilembus persalinus]|uniref:Cyclic nucleotide-binding protein n=1 Tax=Pseudocohnilembus persalinus TaxID=266149 RepID=A0A0V0QYQ8_PSEPJ|nr:Cyclic nucleotide-binding protein [Pseudocohnilembus persalinus]|eukprot:KRX07364.1 Cyclic nucleotide-binding protein [Pseudocohnilembus persalinus]